MSVETTGWLELTLDYRSNLRCLGCTACDGRDGELSLEQVGQWLRWGRQRGLDNLWVGGGEPTLRPDLGKIVRFARRVGYRRVLLQTNGMRLAHSRYADAVIGSGVDVVSLNVKSADPAIHDRLSGRDGAFSLLEQALNGLADKPVTVVADALLTRSTLATLPDTIRWFARRGVQRFWLWLLSAADNASDEVVSEIPHPDDFAEPLAQAAQAAEECGVILKSLHTPRCWMPRALHGLVSSAAELDLWVVNPGQRAPMRLEQSAMEGGAWLPACSRCAARPMCSGPRQETIDRFGDAVFKPIRPAISNAFHYVLDAVQRPWPKGAPCPRLAGPDVEEGGRVLYIHHKDHLTGASTASTDFSSDQIAAIKRLSGQLYLDVSSKDAPTDFAADLRQLRPDRACLSCPRSQRCGGAFVIAPGNAFERDDRRVREVFAQLRGDVLDLGAGEGPYVESLEAATRSGRIRYTAVEPDPAHADTLKRRAPWADVRIGAAEDLTLERASLDHALIVRSYNHLEEPDKVLKVVVDALRHGGQLVVVDNEAFGLVRTSTQAKRAEQSTAAFEHTRNDGAEAHISLVEQLDLPLRLVERRDVGPETSNQWLVVWRVERASKSLGEASEGDSGPPMGTTDAVVLTPANFATWFTAQCQDALAARGWAVMDIHGFGPWEIALELRRLTDGLRYKAKVRRRTDSLAAAARTNTFDILHAAHLPTADMSAVAALAETLRAVEDSIRFTGPKPMAAFEAHPGGTAPALNLAIPGECGQKCSFCGIREELKVGSEAPAGLVDKLREDISRSAQSGTHVLRINGIEPLAAPYLWDLLAHAKAEGFDEFHLLSTFRTLSGSHDVDRLLDAMPDRYRFYVPLYGSRADVHDAVTGRQGSFDEVLAVLSKLRSHMLSRGHWDGCGQVVVTTVVNRKNAHDMHALALLLGNRVRAWNMHLPFPNTGSAQDPYFTAALSMSEALGAIAPASFWPAGSFQIGEIVPCVMLNHQRRTGHLLLTADTLASRQTEPSGTFYESAGFAHSLADGKSIAFTAATTPCPHVSRCALAALCPQKVYAAYAQHFGLDELQPVDPDDLSDELTAALNA